jgi:leucyl aminopeptidase
MMDLARGAHRVSRGLMIQPTSPIALSDAPWSSLDVEWLFVPVAEQETTVGVFDAASGLQLAQLVASGEFKAKAYDTLVTPVVAGGWQPRRIALVGLGKPSDFGAESLRRAATTAALEARARGVKRLAFACRWPDGPAVPPVVLPALAGAVADGLVSGLFDGARYKTADHDRWDPQLLVVSVGEGESGAETENAVRRGVVLAESANAARTLANEPGNRLRPRDFAAAAAQLVSAVGLSVEILDEERIEALGMRLLAGVARGSEEPPRLLVVRYQPSVPRQSPVLGIVGKGVTFDSGGISIKPAAGMERMKDDMAGGAAVVAALCAAARLKAPVPVIGIVPIAENMPSGHAIRPGDVLDSASGKTVEVLDTDAEGRLILADALWYARQLGATHVVDIATLTGACMVALGHTTSGLFGRPQSWVDTVQGVAQRAGDRLWQMPLFADYREQLRSDIADIKNVGGRPGGAITAAMFLSEFAGEGPWAHLDVAGTAWNEDAKPYLPKGPSGAGVRTLAELAFALRPDE